MATDCSSSLVHVGLKPAQILLSIIILAGVNSPSGCNEKKPAGSLLIAFPKSSTELRLVFSEALDRASAERPESYSTASGLKILGASLDPNDPKRVTLKTEAMPTWETAATTGQYETPYDEPLRVDVVKSTGARTISGATLAKNESPRFIQGIPSVFQIQKPRENAFPFTSRYVGLIAAHHYNKDGGADSNVLIDALGFAFLHRESGGPFNSIKIVTRKHVPGVAEASARLRQGQGLHVLWAGGEIRTVDGETQLVDTGFMEGSIIEPPLKSPPPYPIKTAEISNDAAKTLRAKSLQGVIVHFDNVVVDSISAPDDRRLRHFIFHDESGARVSGLLLHTVTHKVEAGQKFQSLRGIVHQPRPAQYEVIVEMNEHMVMASGAK